MGTRWIPHLYRTSSRSPFHSLFHSPPDGGPRRPHQPTSGYIRPHRAWWELGGGLKTHASLAQPGDAPSRETIVGATSHGKPTRGDCLALPRQYIPTLSPLYYPSTTPSTIRKICGLKVGLGWVEGVVLVAPRQYGVYLWLTVPLHFEVEERCQPNPIPA